VKGVWYIPADVVVRKKEALEARKVVNIILFQRNKLLWTDNVQVMFE
jgi:hypothetical protein